MGKVKKQTYMLHYTSLSRLMEILETGRLSLANPIFWKDKNDAFSVAKSSSKAVGVICFSLTEEESNLFWECYANDGIGVCIVFDKKSIEYLINRNPKYKMKEITYLHIDKDERKSILDQYNKAFRLKEIRDLAFVKRDAYSEEKEIRLALFTERKTFTCGNVVDYLELGKPISSHIHKILLSPFLEEKQRRDIKILLGNYLEKMNLNIKICSSKIACDVRWRNAIRQLKRTCKK